LDPMLPKNGVYMVEDLHAAYWEEYGGGRADSFVNQATNSIDSLNADHSRGVITAGFITRGTFSICFYDSIVAFDKGDVWRKEAPQTGRNGFDGKTSDVAAAFRGKLKR